MSNIRQGHKVAFAACLNCIDGRTFEPLLMWIRRHCGADFVDMITAPGMVHILARGGADCDDHINALGVSIEAHGCTEVFVAGHADCAGNPAPDDEHKGHVLRARDRVAAHVPSHRVAALWVGCDGSVEALNG